MKRAIVMAERGIDQGQSPFGSIIVRGNEVVAEGHNQVWRTTDPSAHAEIITIRKAAQILASIDLSDCVLYSTCEPCPMCASAIHWAKLEAVVFGARIADAQHAGFQELPMSIEELYGEGRSPVMIVADVMRDECARLFDTWIAAGGKAY